MKGVKHDESEIYITVLVNWLIDPITFIYMSSLRTVVRPSELKIKYPKCATLDSNFITLGDGDIPLIIWLVIYSFLVPIPFPWWCQPQS